MSVVFQNETVLDIDAAAKCVSVDSRTVLLDNHTMIIDSATVGLDSLIRNKTVLDM